MRGDESEASILTQDMAGDSRWNLIKQGAEAKLHAGAYLGQPAIMKVCLVDPYVDGSCHHPILDLLFLFLQGN